MKLKNIEVKNLKNNESELSEDMYRICVFCDKLVHVNKTNLYSCANLSHGIFYCPFCLRNNHNYRSKRNILIMSFRAIIGYYYYKIYCKNANNLYISDINRIIENHVNTGLQNPVFSYDPDTYLWFIDFNRIGVEKNKAPFNEVLSITHDMFLLFETKNYTTNYISDELWKKFSSAMILFYEKRKRPKFKKKLIPTFNDAVNEKNEFWEMTRNFTKSKLIIN